MSLYKLAERQPDWQRLEGLLGRNQRDYTASDVIALAQLYRSVCTDLSLASAYHVPDETVQYLHELVGRAHAHFYGTLKWTWIRWREYFLDRIPRLMFRNPFFRISSALFWLPFILCGVLGFVDRGFSESVLGPLMMAQMDEMYADGLEQRSVLMGGAGTSFYIFHNVSIALQCFASGLLLGIGSVYALLFNGVFLGSVFGYMLSGDYANHFGEFVLAHGPLELTGICVSGAAGMKMGFSWVHTQGERRVRSLQKAMPDVLAMVLLAAVMIASAAFIEGFVSPSSLPVGFKVAVMVVTACLIVVYFQLPRLRGRHAD